jgi:hypothetical protein
MNERVKSQAKKQQQKKDRETEECVFLYDDENNKE